MILSNDGVLPNTLPAAEVEAVTKLSALPPATLRDSERALILQTLESVGWVIGGASGAANKLGLKRTTLIAKMKRLGINRGQSSAVPVRVVASVAHGLGGAS